MNRCSREDRTGRDPGGTLRRAFPWLILSVSLAGLLVLGVSRGLFGLWLGADRAYSQAHQRLLQALGPARPVEARLSGGLPYGSYHPPGVILSPAHGSATAPPSTRGEDGSSVLVQSELPLPQGVAKAIIKDEEREPSPENRAALAVLELIQGHPEAAIPELRESHKRKPSDPRILNDLAAASLAVGEATGDPWPVLEAIDSAEQAERLEPLPPARFNLALALERLDLRTRAIAAWERYLDLDTHSSWAQEAEQRLARLKIAVAKAGPQLPATPPADLAEFPDNPWARRQLGERVLLTRWAEQILAGRPIEAEAAIAQAETLAATLSPAGGHLLTASIGAIREAEQSGDRARLDLLARGHQIFGQAFLLNREERAVEARALIAEAIRDLQAAKTPFELRARVLQAWMAEEPDWDEACAASARRPMRGGLPPSTRRSAGSPPTG